MMYRGSKPFSKPLIYVGCAIAAVGCGVLLVLAWMHSAGAGAASTLLLGFLLGWTGAFPVDRHD